MTAMRSTLVSALLCLPSLAFGQAPTKAGLGGPIKGLSMTDPKTVKFEMDLLAAVNELRKAAKLEPLAMDDKLRVLTRQHAEGVAKGERAANALEEIIKTQKLAPNGFRIQYVAGTKPKEILKEIDKDKTATGSLKQEFARIAIGAFWVPEDKAPYFQAGIVVVTELDPMAGKPGLTLAETNKVMNEAASTINTLCYETALRANPNFGGSLVFQLVIGAKGRVDTVKLNVKTNNDRFDDCATDVAKGLVFPAPYKGKPVTLNHPLRFVPPHGDKKVGRLAEGHISRVFRLAEPNIKGCYDERIKTKAGLKGTISLYLLVGVDGGIKSLVVEHDEIGDAELTTCVTTQVQKLMFPAPEFGGEAEVRFPIRFEPPPPTKE
jgi:hypothetical protein